MADRLAKIIYRHVQKGVTDDHPNLLYYPDADDLRRVYVVVVGLPHPYLGAEIFLQLSIPDNFPQAPPELRCLTENGVYATGCKICISVGEFHVNDGAAAGRHTHTGGDWGWRPALGLRGFAGEALNGIIDPDSLNMVKHPDSGQGGIGILCTPRRERAALAAQSRAYNAARLGALRQQAYEHAAANPHLAAAKNWLRQCAIVDVMLAAGAPSRESLAAAIGAPLAARIPEAALAEAGRVLCRLDPGYHPAGVACIAGAEAEIRGLGAELPFLRDALARTALPLGELRDAVLACLDASMRCDFSARDAIIAAIAGR